LPHPLKHTQPMCRAAEQTRSTRYAGVERTLLSAAFDFDVEFELEVDSDADSSFLKVRGCGSTSIVLRKLLSRDSLHMAFCLGHSQDDGR